VALAPSPPVLVAHSLGCLLAAHWLDQNPDARISGVFLVAVPEPLAPSFPAVLASFVGVPNNQFNVPAVIIASSNDPYAGLEATQARAHAWGAKLLVIGALGHINGESGIGRWPEGRDLLSAFVSGMSPNDRTGRSRRIL
jgi:predicted alpha/beta hydrolase family esterase